MSERREPTPDQKKRLKELIAIESQPDVIASNKAQVATESIEFYKSEVDRIIEAIRIARNAPADWGCLLTSRTYIGDFFAERDDWEECMQVVMRELGVKFDVHAHVIDVAKLLRQ